MRQTDLFLPANTGDPVEYGHRLLDIAVRRYEPDAVFGLFSGGHDSLCATHLASQHPAFTAAVHINTGIGVEKTRQFVRQTCADMGWPLKGYPAENEGQLYDNLILEHGFPGPAQHRTMYTSLKERALRSLIRDHKSEYRSKIILVTGVRRSESRRRMGTVEPINTLGSQVWVAPLTHFTDRHKTDYMAEHDLPRNEVVDLLHMSGECLCGAFAKPGELEWLEFCGFTDEVERIRRLESQAAAAGVPCKWGERPPAPADPRQQSLPLCVSCEARVA